MKSCLKSARKTFYNNNPKPKLPLKNLLVLPFDEHLQSTKSLFEKLNISLVFSYQSTIKSMLIKNSPQSNLGCIYKIPCNVCDKFYIGETGRTLKERVKEHKSYITKADSTKSVFNHMSSFDHNINFNNATELLFSSTYFERNFIESFLIEFSKNSNFNIQSGKYSLDPLIFNLMTTFKKYSSILA